MKKKAFTLLEIMIVLMIVTILITISFASFFQFKNSGLDEEAKTILKQMQMAEKFYNLKMGEYYPSSSYESDIDNINENLNLDLEETNWNYLCRSNGCVQANLITDSSVRWRLRINEDEPVKGSSCP